MKNIICGLLILILLVILTGCSNTVQNLHDERFSVGCAMVKANIALGAFNQEGNAEACKLVCSENLPEGFTYAYDSGMCKATIGNTND